jgi:acyl transferase domain-containing protein
VVGHSSGEIAAAYCVGGLSRESAWKVAYYRGLVSHYLAETSGDGAMVSVGLSETAIKPYLKVFNGDLAVGCINSPLNVTVSGNAVEIAKLEEILKRDAVFAQRLQVKIAYHSPKMNEVACIYRSLIQNLCSATHPSEDCIMFSSVTGSHVAPNDLGQSEYWIQNLVSPVKFSQALANISVPQLRKLGKARLGTVRTQVHHLLEIGPHSALRGPIRECLAVTNTGSLKTTYGSLLVRRKPALETALSAAGYLHCLGFPLRISAVNDSPESLLQRCLVTNLPSYPFNRTAKYWREGRVSKSFRFRQNCYHELLGTPVSDWNPLNARWQNNLRLSDSPWLKDHKVCSSERTERTC